MKYVEQLASVLINIISSINYMENESCTIFTYGPKHLEENDTRVQDLAIDRLRDSMPVMTLGRNYPDMVVYIPHIMRSYEAFYEVLLSAELNYPTRVHRCLIWLDTYDKFITKSVRIKAY